MKRYLAGLFAALSIFALSISPIVMAQTTTDTSTQTTLQQRIDQYKKLITKKLTTSEQTKLKARCKAAQVIVAERQKALTTIGTVRLNAYDKIQTNLGELITKLEKQNIDVTKLKDEQKMLTTKVETFKTNLTSYKQSISDTSTLDCLADPTAFKAALETARADHQKTGDSAKDIKTYITQTIIPTLNEIKTQLSSTGGTQ